MREGVFNGKTAGIGLVRGLCHLFGPSKMQLEV